LAAIASREEDEAAEGEGGRLRTAEASNAHALNTSTQAGASNAFAVRGTRRSA
jgi:hypothetical protein